MGLKHKERDLLLPLKRKKLLENALDDLRSDSNVIGIYESGSLARGDFDNYSDIDLHIFVRTEMKKDYLTDKQKRAAKWGKVLFYEGNASAPYLVTHYECFVKLDTWYHEKNELVPSVWLQDAKTYYDPERFIQRVIDESNHIKFELQPDEVENWRNKTFAYVHEIYRAVMRNELYAALANLDHVRWLIVSGWYTEENRYLFNPYLVWSKIERNNSELSKEQREMLESWNCDRNSMKIMETLLAIYPEFLRLNNVLSNKAGISDEKELCRKVFEIIL